MAVLSRGSSHRLGGLVLAVLVPACRATFGPQGAEVPETDAEEISDSETSPTEAPDYSSLPPPPDPDPQPGTPWATSVMAALNDVEAPTHVEGELQFRLTVCADGGFSVEAAGGTLSPEDEDAVLEAVRTAHLPSMPAGIRERLTDDCDRIRYVFTWTPSGVQ